MQPGVRSLLQTDGARQQPMTRQGQTVPHKQRRRAVAGAVIGATLLVPWQVTAESSLASGARTANVGATAHLDFRVIIPPVLALSIDGAGAAARGAPRVSIFSNTRQVLFTASASPVADGRVGPGRPGAGAAPGPRAQAAAGASADAQPRTVLLSAARHAVIRAESSCQPGGPRVVATPGSLPRTPVIDLRPVICTVAMP